MNNKLYESNWREQMFAAIILEKCTREMTLAPHQKHWPLFAQSLINWLNQGKLLTEKQWEAATRLLNHELIFERHVQLVKTKQYDAIPEPPPQYVPPPPEHVARPSWSWPAQKAKLPYTPQPKFTRYAFLDD